MEPTVETRTRLRKLLNEPIAEGQTEADTRFLDEELDDLLKEAASVYGAASVGWTIKAGMLQGQIEKYTTGQEQYTMTSLKDQLAHAETMADKYQAMGSVGVGSLIGRIKGPDVLC